MAVGYQALTDKEKETLRLILHGHDAKSMAGELDLSVHTVNERLRNARRKLEVTSSKEAARLLLEEEGDTPQFLGHKRLGDAGAAGTADKDATKAGRSLAWLIGGLLTMTALFAALALLAPLPAAEQAATRDDAAEATAVNAEIEAAARQWLALLDDGDWDATYDGTANAFRELNTREIWADVSEDARGPLGAMVSRTLILQEFVPAPPRGYSLLRFRTSFANRADVVESVTLVREDGSWKISGVTID